MKESQIQRKIIERLECQGCYVVKTIACNRAGVPDLLICKEGKFIAIEVKTPTGRVSDLQKAHIKMIREAGGEAIVARSVKDLPE